MMSAEQGPRSGIRFSMVVAVYNVAPYLADFIASIETQTFDLTRVEVIMVDDGSTDDSGEILAGWNHRRPDLVTVLTKANEGQASARNLGLKVATGEWVTFTDPDDKLDQDYLQITDRFLVQHQDVEMVATTRLILNDATGEVTDTHPLRRLFNRGDRVMDLDLRPTVFHVSAPAAFFKLKRIAEIDLAFDERIRPTFEDGHFCIKYLLDSPRRKVAFLPSAKYIWRRRTDQSSATQTGRSHPGRYTDILEFGYLDVLEEARRQYGHVPLWLQNHMIYDLRWLLIAEVTQPDSPTAATGETAERFHQLMPQVLRHIEPGMIASFTVRPLRSIWRDILLHSWSEEPWHTPQAVVSKFDEQEKLARVTYRYVGAPPSEEFRNGEFQIEPDYEKRRDVRMFDRTLIHERIAWVPINGPLSLHLNGDLVELIPEWPSPAAVYMSRERIRSALRQESVRSHSRQDNAHKQPPAGKAQDSRARDKLRRRAGSFRNRRRFKDAWALQDDAHGRSDNAERLFRYLRDTRPETNAWFVVEPEHPAGERLQHDGYGDRIVEHGSDTWKMLMANCSFWILSHAETQRRRPPDIVDFTEPGWLSVLLRPEVVTEDQSDLINRTDFDLIVASTPEDYASITGDGTAYAYTTKEVKLVEAPLPPTPDPNGQEPRRARQDTPDDRVQRLIASEIDDLLKSYPTSQG